MEEPYIGNFTPHIKASHELENIIDYLPGTGIHQLQ